MGYPYDHLISTSLLRENPGVTFAEYAKLLNSVVISRGMLYLDIKDSYWIRKNGLTDDPKLLRQAVKKRNLARWDASNQKMGKSPGYHAGLYSVAAQLGLRRTQHYIDWMYKDVQKDFFGLKMGQRDYYLLEKDGNIFFEVSQVVSSIPSDHYYWRKELELVKKNSKLFKGKVIFDGRFGEQVVIERVVRDYRPSRNAVTLIVRDIHSRVDRRHYSPESFERFYPQLAADKVFNFAQKSGEIYADLDAKFRWEQRNGKLYLDEHRFSQIVLDREYPTQYTDYVATKQAIQYKAWKMLGRSSGWMINNFHKRWPQTVPEHEKAVWDLESSRIVKEQKGNNFDLMRFRLLGRTESINATLSKSVVTPPANLSALPLEQRLAISSSD